METSRVPSPLNVVVLGASRVGKSAIISQFVNQSFPDHETITIELEEKKCTCTNKKETPLNIVDTPGGYCFGDRRSIAIRSGDAFVVVFALDDDASFMKAALMRDDIARLKRGKCPIVVVGNKSDSRLRVIEREEAMVLSKYRWKAGYVEASAKDNSHISEIFKELLRQQRKHNSFFARLGRKTRRH